MTNEASTKDDLYSKERTPLSAEAEAGAELIRINQQMFVGTINVLGQQNAALHQKVAQLTADNAALHQKVAQLTADNAALHQQACAHRTDRPL